MASEEVQIISIPDSQNKDDFLIILKEVEG